VTLEPIYDGVMWCYCDSHFTITLYQALTHEVNQSTQRHCNATLIYIVIVNVAMLTITSVFLLTVTDFNNVNLYSDFIG
jgi:hypothetical protein